MGTALTKTGALAALAGMGYGARSARGILAEAEQTGAFEGDRIAVYAGVSLPAGRFQIVDHRDN